MGQVGEVVISHAVPVEHLEGVARRQVVQAGDDPRVRVPDHLDVPGAEVGHVLDQARHHVVPA